MKKSVIQSINFCSNNSILYNGLYYYADTVLYDTLATISGCDSLLTTILNAGAYAPKMSDSSFFCESVLAELDAGDDYIS